MTTGMSEPNQAVQGPRGIGNIEKNARGKNWVQKPKRKRRATERMRDYALARRKTR